MIEFATYLACFILFVLAIFQAALAAGAPIGHFAWGGAHKVLPTKLRIGSAAAIFIYGVFAMFIFDKAGIVDVITSQSVVTVGMWIITVYFLLGIVMNALSRSNPERLVMTPVALALAVLFLFVTLN